MADLLGYGANAPNVTTTRPADTRTFGATDTWGKDCSSPNAQDGTGILAGFMNGVLGQIRALIRGNGQTALLADIVAVDNTDDTMVLRAIQQLIQRGLMSFGIDTGAAGALVAALNPPLAEYKAGTRIRVLVLHDNPGAAVINVNNLGNRAIVRKNGAALQPKDLPAGGIVALDDDGAQYQLDIPAEFGNAAQLVTSSAALNLTLQQRAIALSRSVAPAAQPINLPAGAGNGHEVIIDDVWGNLHDFPVTVIAPVGETIARGPAFQLNVNFQSTTFRLFDDGTTRIWSRSK